MKQLLELTRVDNGKPATTLICERRQLFEVMPGDMTRYRVQVSPDNWVMAWVGIYPETVSGGIVYCGWADVAPFGEVTGYSKELLTYFCKLALDVHPKGNPVPEGLSRYKR